MKDSIEFETFGGGVLKIGPVKRTTAKEFKQIEKQKMDIDKVLRSGEWWKLWEEDIKEIYEYAKAVGYSPHDVIVAIEEIKNIFDDEWFKEVYPNHPILRWLIHPKGTMPIIEVIGLGKAIRALGGIAELSPNQREDLKKKGYFGRRYEIEVLAWLKGICDDITLEKDLRFGKEERKPDAKISINGKEFYVEIIFHEIPGRELSAHEALSDLSKELNSKLPNKGIWDYYIDLGLDNMELDLQKLEQAIKTTREIILSNKPPFEVSKSGVHVKIRYVNEEEKTIPMFKHGSITGYGNPQLSEFLRIKREMIDSCKKAKDHPMILIIRPGVPLVLPPEILKKIIEWIFIQASKENRDISKIQQLWIDFTFLASKDPQRDGFIFIPFHNPN